MNTEEYNYELPENLIAQTPLSKRDSSRLLVLDKSTGEVEHKKFDDIIDYMEEGDTLVLNDSKVIPARLFGVKESTKASIEILMLKEEKNVWECLVKPAKRIKKGDIIVFKKGMLEAECIEVLDEGIRKLNFIFKGIFYEVLDKLGEMPLPPYIHEKLKDKDRYQTVYAKNNGSAAAPTAGLHFTQELLNKINEKGVNIAYITLHVGLGTFRPVSVDDISNHKMHSEFYMIDNNTAQILNDTRKSNKKIISVGTTTTRTLETILSNKSIFKEESGWTDIFIYPGFKFKAVDMLITNFHLPKSTLMMLVSAFANRDKIMNAYNEAINEKYRFFSFGDSMVIK